jgi:hypothetical protein
MTAARLVRVGLLRRSARSSPIVCASVDEALELCADRLGLRLAIIHSLSHDTAFQVWTTARDKLA